MAIALDSDLRNASAQPAADKSRIRPASSDGSDGGDDFATRLKRVREEAEEAASSQPVDALMSAASQSSLLAPDWSGAPPFADQALAPPIAGLPVALGEAPAPDIALTLPTATANSALTLPVATAAAEPTQNVLPMAAFLEAPAIVAPAPAVPEAAIPAAANPVPVQSTAGKAPEVSELRTDSELVMSDVKAAEAGTGTPSMDQTAILAGQSAASGPPPGVSPAPDAKVAEAEQPADPASAPLPEDIAPVASEATIAVAAAGVIAAPTMQASASGDKPPSNPAVAAPKASPKLAAIAKAEANNPAPPSPIVGIQPDLASAPVASLSDATGLDTAGSSAQGSTVLTFASAGPSASQPSASLTPAAAAPFTSPAPVLVAVPAEVVNIVSKTAEDGQSDRVVVQLDPPELGRVSIDFKFDAQGVQHVIITSETPEAMRQLRQMHGELVQALERQGIGNQNMTFQHQQQSQQQSPQANPLLRVAAQGTGPGAAGPSLLAAIQPQPSSPHLSAGGRLDIRL